MFFLLWVAAHYIRNRRQYTGNLSLKVLFAKVSAFGKLHWTVTSLLAELRRQRMVPCVIHAMPLSVPHDTEQKST